MTDDADATVDPAVRERLHEDALASLERVEAAHGPAERRDPLAFGPRAHDPDAPPATVGGQRELLAGIAGTVVVDAREARDPPRLCLVNRSYGGGWESPGGAVEPGESLREAAVRETEEETGLDVEVTGLFYTRLVEHRYADGGSLPVPMAIFRARAVGGALADRPDRRLPDGRPELDAVEWFPVDELPPGALDRERLAATFGR